MKGLFGKLGFVHKRLWQQDGGYRIALLFGPAPLIGAALGGALWAGITSYQQTTYHPPGWAARSDPKLWTATDGAAPAIEPTRPLPATGPDGSVVGYHTGWSITANPVDVSPTKDVNIHSDPAAGFTVDSPNVTMAQILAAGPKNMVFAAIGSGAIVIRESGRYGLSARLERPPGPIADCIVRLGIGGRRLLSVYNMELVGNIQKNFEPAWFELQPGLYPLGWAFGCWRGNEMNNSGRLTIFLAKPGAGAAQPLQSIDLIR